MWIPAPLQSCNVRVIWRRACSDGAAELLQQETAAPWRHFFSPGERERSFTRLYSLRGFNVFLEVEHLEVKDHVVEGQ
ncbi:hypothetical protein JOB18_027403 [Solea senegalensis]|uniref:Uncharacterized protein n=1 Tax=Solea senegalensis TaxID=28829 RepID=A0AAV6QIR4_SOLSE|nr:hypothetical protein JOB18_027403 [Solea senegalensis]